MSASSALSASVVSAIITDEFVPLPNVVFGPLLYCTDGISLICMATIIVCILRQRQIPIDSYFILSIFFGDVLFAGTIFIFIIISEVNRGWSLGISGCALAVEMLIFSAGTVIFSIIALTLHRYLIIIHRIHLSERAAKILIAGIWISLAGVIALFVGVKAPEMAIGLQDGLYCFVLAYEKNPVAEAASALTLLCILSPGIILPYCYYCIVTKYIRRNKEMLKNDAESSAPRQRSKNEKVETYQFSPNEIKLIKKSIAITFTYIICWSPFAAKLIYELITKQAASLEFNIAAAFIAACDPIANCLIILLYDAKTLHSFFELFHLESGFPFRPKESGNSNSDRNLIQQPQADTIQLNEMNQKDTIKIVVQNSSLVLSPNRI